MTFLCSSCLEVFETNSKRKTHIRCAHQLLVVVKYPGDHVEKNIPRNPNDNKFHCRICNNYSNANPSLLKNHAKNCPSFRVHASASSAIATPSVSATPTVPIVPSVLPSTFMPVEPSVSAESLLPNAPSVTTSAVPLQASVAHESNLTDANAPTEDTNDDADSAPFASTEEVEFTELDTSVYNSEYQSLGMVIHLQSGSVICVRCRCAVQLGNVVGHFGRNHSLNRWIAQYNVHQQQRYGEQLDVELSQIHPEPLTIHNLEEKLRDQGAVLYNEHGLYVAPLKNPLPAISLLDVLPGFMCGFCPVEDVTAVAAFTGAVSTMAKHMKRNHRGLNHNQYTTCHVQHLYKDQGHKVYFRVEQQYSGPTIPSTITSEGDALFETFLCENPEFDEGFNPDATIGDSRVFSRFYEYVNWFDLVVDVAGADTNENRLLLHDWVNARTPRLNDEVAQFDLDLKLLIRQYFNYMQRAVSSSSASFYRFRIAVMHYDPKEPAPTVGLRALNVRSVNKYFDLWFKYVKMMMMAAAPSFGSDEDTDLHIKYREFGQAIFNDINGDTSRRFVIDIENIIAEMRSAGDSFRASERAFPVLHSYFMSLVSEQTPPFNQRVKCSILVFTAFSQIEASGCWKNVAYVKSVPARLKYLFRSIILYELLLKNDGLVFDDVDNNVQAGTAINDDGLDTDLTEEELEEFNNNA